MAHDAEPVACVLDPEELKSRQRSLLPGLAPHVRAIRETPDGYEFEFAVSGEILAQLAEVIDAERQCCRFLKFELIVEPAGGPVRLRLGGPPGAREFLASLLDLKTP
jgi:hypothetical protein